MNVKPWIAIDRRIKLNRCVEYSPVSGSIVYSEGDEAFATSVAVERTWKVCADLSERHVALQRAECWDSLNRLENVVPSLPTATLFLHGVGIPNERRLLVVLELARHTDENMPCSFWGHSIDEGKSILDSSAKHLIDTTEITEFFSLAMRNGDTKIQIFAGRIDQTDLRSFEIPFRIGERNGSIKGSLEIDGTITLHVILLPR